MADGGIGDAVGGIYLSMNAGQGRGPGRENIGCAAVPMLWRTPNSRNADEGVGTTSVGTTDERSLHPMLGAPILCARILEGGGVSGCGIRG